MLFICRSRLFIKGANRLSPKNHFMIPTNPARLILRKILFLLPLILLVNQSASLASSTLTTYQKVMMAQSIGFCLYAEGIMSSDDSHEIVNTSLSREKVTEKEVDSVILAKQFKEDLDAFIDLAGGCKRVVTVSEFR